MRGDTVADYVPKVVGLSRWSLCDGAYDEVQRLPVPRTKKKEREFGCNNGDDSECRARLRIVNAGG
jgi:hypothetical protein